MFSVPKDRVQWIEGDFKADLNGLIPELKEWADTKAKAMLEELRKSTGTNPRAKSFFAEHMKRLSDPITRGEEVLEKLQSGTIAVYVQLHMKSLGACQ